MGNSRKVEDGNLLLRKIESSWETAIMFINSLTLKVVICRILAGVLGKHQNISHTQLKWY